MVNESDLENYYIIIEPYGGELLETTVKKLVESCCRTITNLLRFGWMPISNDRWMCSCSNIVNGLCCIFTIGMNTYV